MGEIYTVVPQEKWSTTLSAPYPVQGPDGAVYDFNDRHDAFVFAERMSKAYLLGKEAGYQDGQVAAHGAEKPE